MCMFPKNEQLMDMAETSGHTRALHLQDVPTMLRSSGKESFVHLGARSGLKHSILRAATAICLCGALQYVVFEFLNVEWAMMWPWRAVLLTMNRNSLL